MVAQSDQAQVPQLTQRELECGRRLTAAMFAMGKQQATIGARLAKTGGFDRSGFILLKTLVAMGPTRSSTLAAAVHSDPSTISRQVAALVRDGLVERQADQEDGRASLLAATPAGVALLEEQRRRMGVSLARVVQQWSPEDLDRFVELFERFVADHESYLPTLIDECARWARSEGEN
ncbi:MAG TPA: MarR family transcriptional regulator [Actinophytocola sp.]|uniref:MarR family winged helix-turn-helix transcriptional regulator n=1 Tax=Actinophytocola sp. TaxID=1872138 RepID=UPI002DB9E920|nr:MarR family transcriptional regulator [Actinophytocola sp.]HEU5471854.1 MarR family transcriptional regulator [Actinophytocola sp.]